MAAVQGKVTSFIGLTKESLDGASDSLDGDIKRRLIGQAQHDDMAVVNCFCKTTALQGYVCISSVYISFQVLQHITFRRMPASMLGFLVLYADDILLLAPSVYALQLIVTLSEPELN